MPYIVDKSTNPSIHFFGFVAFSTKNRRSSMKQAVRALLAPTAIHMVNEGCRCRATKATSPNVVFLMASVIFL